MRTKQATRNIRLSGSKGLILFGLVALALCVHPAQALVVTVDLGWGYNQDVGGNDLLEYNLQVGSVVQIIMYDSTVASAPGTDADDNFDITGDYGGPDLSSEPYSSGHVPEDTTTYDPHSAPADHYIVYTDTVQAAPYLDDNGNTWWQVFAQFEVLGNFDRLYVRVFGTDDIFEERYWASYWGLSDVQEGTNLVGTWYVGPLDEITATHSNYFEVIPEPGTMALFLLGGAGLVAGRWRRKAKSSRT